LATNTADILTKQPLTTNATDLETNSIFIEGNLNLKKTTYFDTIVIRRPTGITASGNNTNIINLNELKVWVNGSNILVENSAILTSYFAVWADKQIDNGDFHNYPASNIYNNIIESETGAHSNEGADALIIKNIPLTSVSELQSIVLYNRTINPWALRVIGLAVELYNSTNDPDLNAILAITNVITSRVNRYRFDFPSIDTYTGGFVGEDSITNIVNNTDALTEDANIFSFYTELTGDVWGGEVYPLKEI
jgi:hypothetical protein